MPRLDRDAIVDAVDLWSLADELLGPARGGARSRMWPCPSPGHSQTGRTPPVSVFVARNGEQRWHCHGCGAGGTAVDLVMAVRAVGVREALEELAARVGQDERVVAHSAPVARHPASTRMAGGGGDLRGLADFVDECAERLWRPEGRAALQWLTGTRHLPADVLHINRIGVDPGRSRQSRPDGMPSAGPAIVLPVLEEGTAVFAQLRALRPLPGRPRYLNASSALAPNPRTGCYDASDEVGSCVIVTEGVIDALTANAAGYHAVAVFGAALVGIGHAGERSVVRRLLEEKRGIVVAFDADRAGRQASCRLQELLKNSGRRSASVKPPDYAKDLNGWMGMVDDWPRIFRAHVRTAVAAGHDTRRVARR